MLVGLTGAYSAGKNRVGVLLEQRGFQVLDVDKLGHRAIEAEKAAIARVVRASLGWFESKDFDLFFRSIADDPDYFVFQPTSRGTVRGTAQARERWAIFRDPTANFTSLDIRELRIHP